MTDGERTVRHGEDEGRRRGDGEYLGLVLVGEAGHRVETLLHGVRERVLVHEEVLGDGEAALAVARREALGDLVADLVDLGRGAREHAGHLVVGRLHRRAHHAVEVVAHVVDDGRRVDHERAQHRLRVERLLRELALQPLVRLVQLAVLVVEVRVHRLVRAADHRVDRVGGRVQLGLDALLQLVHQSHVAHVDRVRLSQVM